MKVPPSAKYQLIYEMTNQPENALSVSKLCEIASVSRSGYYDWISNAEKRRQREEQDDADFELVLSAYKHRGYDKGARGIYMRLLHQNPPVIMNIKKIRRLMKKYQLKCPIRKANPYRRMAKAIKTSNTAPNLLQREFREHGARAVLLTDITYLINAKGIRCYLSTIMDAYTKQLLSWVLSDSLEEDFVLETVNQLIKKHGVSLNTETLINSDQGVHYRNIKFIQLLKDNELRQSMSRKANCWDNAPQESFFGHMKDEIDISGCETVEEVRSILNDWTDYYNNDRYQWSLAKLSPNEFYKYIITREYPLPIAPPNRAMKYGTAVSIDRTS